MWDLALDGKVVARVEMVLRVGELETEGVVVAHGGVVGRDEEGVAWLGFDIGVLI